MSALTLTSLVVRDYDEAIAWFAGALDFELRADDDMGNGKRWVVVAPRGERGGGLLLAKAANDEQRAHVGNQTGGRVAFFLEVDDFDAAYARLQAHGARFTESPRHEAYGTVVVLLDLYGNKWDLIGRRK
jgi:predicted enzyme related to lactoylglutathione lyase